MTKYQEKLTMMKVSPIDFLKHFHQYLSKTDDNWSDAGKSFYAHLVDFFELNANDNASEIVDGFEQLITFYNLERFIASPNHEYNQPTIKQRCLHYFADVIRGKRLLAFDYFYGYYFKNGKKIKCENYVSPVAYDENFQF